MMVLVVQMEIATARMEKWVKWSSVRLRVRMRVKVKQRPGEDEGKARFDGQVSRASLAWCAWGVCRSRSL